MARCNRSENVFDEQVARGMPVRIIDLFQAVKVDQEDCQWAAMPLRATDLLAESLFSGAPIVEAGQLVQRGQFVDLRSKALDFREGLNLVSQLVPQAVNQNLLIHHVHAEDQHHPHERSHRLIEKKRISAFVPAQHSGKAKEATASVKNRMTATVLDHSHNWRRSRCFKCVWISSGRGTGASGGATCRMSVICQG